MHLSVKMGILESNILTLIDLKTQISLFIVLTNILPTFTRCTLMGKLNFGHEIEQKYEVIPTIPTHLDDSIER
jgi:hypothetical protein